jgi:hypothetical protein
MIGYTPNNFFTQMIIDHENNNNFKIEKKELGF